MTIDERIQHDPGPRCGVDRGLESAGNHSDTVKAIDRWASVRSGPKSFSETASVAETHPLFLGHAVKTSRISSAMAWVSMPPCSSSRVTISVPASPPPSSCRKMQASRYACSFLVQQAA